MIFPASVERWRSYVSRYGSGQGGADFWLAWINKESGGNVCSYTTYRESGLFQLMPGDNMNVAGTSEAALRPACSGQTVTRAFTESELAEQFTSFSKYLDYCVRQARIKLAAANVRWDESSTDFGKAVKWQHVAPGKFGPWLAAATSGLGRPPANWNELAQYASTIGIPSNWVANATDVGSYWGGGGSVLLIAALVGGAAVLYYLSRRA